MAPFLIWMDQQPNPALSAQKILRIDAGNYLKSGYHGDVLT